MANISFVHARDHADVLFVGTLDWEAAHELVTTLETVFDHYFYRQVELLVSSPGGDTRALAYYLNAVRNWSNKGIRFRTRVISTAASAGAFMVSLGDERVAEGAGATARTSPPLRSCGTTRRRRSSSARPIRRRGTVSTTSVRTALDWRASFVCVPCPRCRLGNAMQRSPTVGSNGASSSRSTWRARANSIPRTRSRSFSTPPPRNSSAMARGRERAGPSLFVRRLPEPALAEHPDSLALARSSCLFVPGACTSVLSVRLPISLPGDNGFVAVAILSFVVGLGVSWIPASKSRQENEPVPCLRVVEVVRLAGTVPKSRGSILVVRIERARSHRSIELHPGGEATCDPAELDLPIPPVPNVIFRRRGLFFEPPDSPQRRESPLFPIPFEKTNRLTESTPTHRTSRETTLHLDHEPTRDSKPRPGGGGFPPGTGGRDATQQRMQRIFPDRRLMCARTRGDGTGNMRCMRCCVALSRTRLRNKLTFRARRTHGIRDSWERGQLARADGRDHSREAPSPLMSLVRSQISR